MPGCDLCGKETALVKAEIESTELSVCATCAKYGKVRKELQGAKAFPVRKTVAEMPEERIIAGFAQLLRKAREERNCSHEEFAKLIKVRESLLAKWESGSALPDIETARHIGRQFNIKLVEKEEMLSAALQEKQQHAEPTLGDFVKIRTRK